MTIAVRRFRPATRCPRRAAVSLIAALTAVLVVPVYAAAQDSKSAALATELSRLMDARKLDSVAAEQGGGEYVGALYFPGAQLLVVSGKFSGSARMKDLLERKEYREVYLDLSSASDRTSRVFIMDLGANGLRFERQDGQSTAIDTADVSGKSHTFDGDWDRAKISEDEYRKTFSSTDEQYSRMLQALIGELKKPS